MKKIIGLGVVLSLVAPLVLASTAETHVATAREYLKQGNREAALQEFNLAIEKKTDDAELYARRGHLLYELNRVDAASQDIDQALKLNPQHAAASFDRSQIDFAAGKLEQALAAIDRAVVQMPDNARYLGGRCVIRVAAGQAEQGLEDCNAALSQTKGRESAYVARGQAYLLLKRDKDALADFKASLEIAPNLMRALYGRGLARQRLGDAEGALDINEAVRRLPGAGREFAPLGIS